MSKITFNSCSGKLDLETSVSVNMSRNILISCLGLGSSIILTQKWLQLKEATSNVSSRCRPRTAVIVGGGIIGLSTALQLVKRGVSVTVLEEKDEVASVASYCNGAIICNSMAASWASANLIGCV